MEDSDHSEPQSNPGNFESMELSDPPGPSPDPQGFGPPWKGFDEIPIRFQVEIGHTTLSIRDWLDGGIGSRIILDSRWKDGVVLKLNGKPVGFGDVVLIRNRIGVRVTQWGHSNRPR